MNLNKLKPFLNEDKNIRRVQVGFQIDPKLLDELQIYSSELGWGGKRKLVEVAIIKLLKELKE
jgi:hypothetical protein